MFKYGILSRIFLLVAIVFSLMTLPDITFPFDIISIIISFMAVSIAIFFGVLEYVLGGRMENLTKEIKNLTNQLRRSQIDEKIAMIYAHAGEESERILSDIRAIGELVIQKSDIIDIGERERLGGALNRLIEKKRKEGREKEAGDIVNVSQSYGFLRSYIGETPKVIRGES